MYLLLYIICIIKDTAYHLFDVQQDFLQQQMFYKKLKRE